MATNGFWYINVNIQPTRGSPTPRNGATANLREGKRARGGGDWSRGGHGFDAMGVVASVGRSRGNACGEILGFIKKDVLDKEQYSQGYSDKLDMCRGEREREQIKSTQYNSSNCTHKHTL